MSTNHSKSTTPIFCRKTQRIHHISALGNKHCCRYNMCIQVLRAVQWIYRHGIFHLDLKLNNFMVASDNRRVVLVDFGCARQEKGLRRLDEQNLLRTQVRLWSRHSPSPRSSCSSYCCCCCLMVRHLAHMHACDGALLCWLAAPAFRLSKSTLMKYGAKPPQL